MVVIGVAGIYRNLQQVSLSNTGYEISRFLRFGRFLAIGNQSPFVAFIDIDKKSYWLEIIKNDVDLPENNIEFDNIYAKPRKLPENIIFSQIKYGDRWIYSGIVEVIFYPDGHCKDTLVHIKSDETINTIMVYSNGQKIYLINHYIDNLPENIYDLDRLSTRADNFFAR